ncbi:MAG TPA: MFS transporter, partial [Sphingomonas sp.]
MSGAVTLLIAVACGAMVANLYYAQTLIDSIGPEIGLSPRSAGMITMLTQLGYGLGLALVVPLGDLFENKRLALIATAGAIVACLGIALSEGP